MIEALTYAEAFARATVRTDHYNEDQAILSVDGTFQVIHAALVCYTNRAENICHIVECS
jgi:hypothetical protein